MDEKLISRAEVADRLAVPEKTLARWAYVGEGPPFYRIGRHARYKPAEVELWLRSRERPARKAATP